VTCYLRSFEISLAEDEVPSDQEIIDVSPLFMLFKRRLKAIPLTKFLAYLKIECTFHQ